MVTHTQPSTGASSSGSASSQPPTLTLIDEFGNAFDWPAYAGYDSCIQNRNASFDFVAETYYGMDPSRVPNRQVRAVHRYYFGELYNAFEASHGQVANVHWCERITSAAVITKDSFVGAAYGSDPIPQELVAIMDRCESISAESNLVLKKPEDKTLVSEKLYGVLAHAMYLADLIYTPGFAPPHSHSHKSGPQSVNHRNSRNRQRNSSQTHSEADALRQTISFFRYQESLELLKSRLNEAIDFYEHAIRRSSIFSYYIGMFLGLLPAGVTALVLYLAIRNSPIGTHTIPIVAILIGGSLGAVVSVMSRTGRDNSFLNRSPATTRYFWSVGFFGFLRPFVGFLMALALYALIAAGLVPFITPPQDSSTSLFFFSAIGFLAGFSERWANGIVNTATSRMSR